MHWNGGVSDHASRRFGTATPMKQIETIILATRNEGKVAELASLLAGVPVRLISAADIAGAPHVEEDAETLRGNAEKKAIALYLNTGLPALADDSGLEVDALGGRPGVHSARYAGEAASDAENRAKLLAALDGSDGRSARFRTALAFVDETGTQFFDGVCEGVITTSERGTGGFGYDRIFQPNDASGRTFAEMDNSEKNLISHRARALASFVDFLAERRGTL